MVLAGEGRGARVAHLVRNRVQGTGCVQLEDGRARLSALGAATQATESVSRRECGATMIGMDMSKPQDCLRLAGEDERRCVERRLMLQKGRSAG